jgi:hypothetical protein
MLETHGMFYKMKDENYNNNNNNNNNNNKVIDVSSIFDLCTKSTFYLTTEIHSTKKFIKFLNYLGT